MRQAVFGWLLVLLLGVGCQAFATTYVTWIDVWYDRNQPWWKPNNADASKNLVNGKWVTMDWCEEAQAQAYLEDARAAGIGVVVADLTNGWRWLDERCLLVQKICAAKGLKFCVAENSLGKIDGFESHAKDIWTNFAGPDAPYHDTYFHYRGKPLIVCYSIRDWYKAYLDCKSEYRSRFSLVWASGEDSSINKWGWQLEPWVGCVPSDDSMFVTSAICWKKQWTAPESHMWRKSIAWLDYNFALARKSNPKYVIVGACEDASERNSWLVSDTAHCEPSRQMRDATGALSTHAYCDRVKQWIRGKPSTVAGGVLRDGAYRIVNASTGDHLGVADSSGTSQGVPGAAIAASPLRRGTLGLFWLYHLGSNHYRIIYLPSGLAVEAKGEEVVQDWDSTDRSQRWTLSRGPDGSFAITSDATGRALTLEEGTARVLPGPAKARRWRLKPVLVL